MVATQLTLAAKAPDLALAALTECLSVVQAEAVVAAAALLAASALVAHAEETLKIGTEGAYPPFNYVDTDGSIKGFDVEIGLALCEKMKVKCEVVAQDWDGIIPALLAKKYDMIIASMFITEERKKVVDFTKPYYKAAMTHVVPKDSDITEFSDAALSGKIIGAQAGTMQEKYLRANFNATSTIVTEPNHDAVLTMLSKGELDLVLVDGLAGYAFLKTEAGDGLETVGGPLESADIMDSSCIAVSKKQPELRESINKAIQDLRRSGEYGKINRKYFDFNVY